MKAILTCAALVVASTTVLAAGQTHWGYTGHEAPENWGQLSADYATCGHGKNQSPVNLTGFVESDLTPIKFQYNAGGKEILNNGHTIQVNYLPGSTIDVDGHTFELKQYHFHSPSENLIDGKSYPMEAHFVHTDDDGNIAVVAVMFEEGAENSSLANAWPFMPATAGKTKSFPSEISAWGVLPGNKDYYRFNGSLTTPPCTEGVTWLVMKAPMTASKEQIAKFSMTMLHPNNRPVQALNARTVMK